MEDITPGACAECDHQLNSGDKFCPECGHPVPVAVIEPETEPETEEATPQQDPARRRRLTVAIIGVAALGLILAGGAWWGLTQNSEAKKQYEASSPVLMSSLDDMAGAQSTDMVRDVAGGAESELSTIQTTLDADPGAPGADRLSTLQQAFTALAALTAYKETNTEAWPDNKPVLMNSLDTLTTYGGTTEQAAAAGEDAARTLDDLTRRVDKRMAKYRKQVKQAKAQARDNRSSLRAYSAQMRSLIDRYTGLRQDTGNFGERMDSEQMYMVDVIDYYTQAATDRRAIANQMSSLQPPAEMRGEHSRIVTIVGDGADAIDAAVAALDDAECYYGECYFEFNTQWGQFQDESDRITSQYQSAYNAWVASMAAAQRAARGADLPDKPDL